MRKLGYIVGLGILFGCLACNDILDMNPENSVTFSNAMQTEREIEVGLGTIEKKIRDYSQDKQRIKPARAGRFASNIWGNNEQTLEQPYTYALCDWSNIYQIIASANIVLPYIDEVKMSEERRNFYKGQVYFFKAFCYYELIRRWGDCPYIGTQVKLEPIAKSAWTTVADSAIYMAQMAADLLPELSQATRSDGAGISYKSTPVRGAANTLLAHLCAWKAGCKYLASQDGNNYDEDELWQRAETACTEVIWSEEYELASTPEEVCTQVLVDGGKEAIFVSVFRNFWNEVGGDPFNVYATIYTTYPVKPMVGPGESRGYDAITYQDVQAMYAGKDQRRNAYFYKPDSMNVQVVGADGSPLYRDAFLYKWRKCVLATSGSDKGKFITFDQNMIWWRFADVVLLRAECRCRLGNKRGAIDDLNTVRRRAGAADYKNTEYGGDLQRAIFKEREKELLLEGERYFDIMRNNYRKLDLRGNFVTLDDQDFIDGAFWNAVGGAAFERNTLMRQNTFWLKKM